MRRSLRISLANKCQLLFGAAVVLIVSAALAVVWVRLRNLTDENAQGTARKFVDAWFAGRITPDDRWWTDRPEASIEGEPGEVFMRVDQDEFETAARRLPFLADAIEAFETHGHLTEWDAPAVDANGRALYRYARAIRKSDLYRIQGGTAAGLRPTVDTPGIANPLQTVLFVQTSADQSLQQLALSRLYIVAAGLFAGLLAIGVFWFITTRLILSPVRVLRDTAEQVSKGDLNIRSAINTGDEFEQLADMFNQMLETLKAHSDQLRVVNKSMDLKLGELAETNVALYEANKVKGEFLANVSHELRTPLNSIIGFAELLEETLKDRTGPVDEKRKRYCSNIIFSSRRLLDLINDLLDLAKIEAGKIEVQVGAMSVADTAEGLVNIIRPQAGKGGVDLRLQIAPDIPMVQTDAGKLQQIVFNFLSNAVKFTPRGGVVTLNASVIPNVMAALKGSTPGASVTLIPPPSGSSALGLAGAAAASQSRPTETSPRLLISVSDTGPGIPTAQHERIFEKFTQLDSTETKAIAGTGLGLTISRELAHLLQGQIIVESDSGRGATFSVMIPLALESRSLPLMPETRPRPDTSAAPSPAGA